MRTLYLYALTVVTAFFSLNAAAGNDTEGYTVNYEASLTAGAGSGEFAPYYISSMRHGRFSQQYNAQAEGKIWRPMQTESRFSYGFGIDMIAGYSSDVEYQRYDNIKDVWYRHSERPAAGWIQQLYGEVKYRSLFAQLGLRERGAALLNQRLTSGDLVESGNSRPIPQLRAGFIDFQDIPFTQGWVQIQGELAYGPMTDGDWWKNHFNRFNYHVVSGVWYNYKRLYFRTNPDKPFSVTFGAQASAMFGGTTDYYVNGKLYLTEKRGVKAEDFFRAIVPERGEGYCSGNHVGSWDLKARYRLGDGTQLKAYFSWPWEDGSGIGRQNGWDGLWGIEYKAPDPWLISGAVVEYLDFTNQSGPIHYSPSDHPGATLNGKATGCDNYYNNDNYNSYANYGMSIGTPALMSPIYDTGGMLIFRTNLMRGVHVGIEGCITPDIDYRVKGGYRKSWGSAYYLLPEPVHQTSVMAEANFRLPKVAEGLSVNLMLEVDRGKMPCNATGAMVTVRYNGSFKF